MKKINKKKNCSLSLQGRFKLEQLYFNNLLNEKQITEMNSLQKETTSHCIVNYKKSYLPHNKLNYALSQMKFDFSPYEDEVVKYIKTYMSTARIKKLPVLSAKKITSSLLESHPEITVCFKTLRNYIMPIKKRLYDTQRKFTPLIHYPNEAQLDFGTSYVYRTDEKLMNMYFMVLSFPHSNTFYCQLMRTRNRHEFVHSLDKIFEHLNCIPPEIWFDNDALFCIISNKERRINSFFEEYRKHHKFKAVFLNTASGNEKGHVENYIRITRNNIFVPIPEVKDLVSYNKKLLVSCDKLNGREHANGEIRKKVLDKDKECFLKFKPFNHHIEKLICIPDELARINVLYKQYYLPLVYANGKNKRSVKVAVDVGRFNIEVFDKNTNESIAKFSRIIDDITSTEITNWGPYLKIFAKNLEYVYTTKFFESLSEDIQENYIFLTCIEKQQVLKNMSLVYEKTDYARAIRITAICLAGKRYSQHDFVMTIHNLKVDPFFRW